HQLTRLAPPARPGLRRSGSIGHHRRGEVFVAFSTGDGDEVHDRDLNRFFGAVVDATEESVLNSLWAAEDVEGREGRVIRALPPQPGLAPPRAAGKISDESSWASSAKTAT